MKKYIAKKDTWFEEGTEVEFLVEITEDSGLFRGIRICNSYSEGHKLLGERYLDEEGCTYDEFTIIEY